MKLHLTRRYRFCASHRLASPRLSEAENRSLYGKCANAFGHGHNYVLEVTVTGPLDPASGTLAHLAALDAFVERQVIEPFDHRYLNEDVPAFRGDRIPTTENLCIEIFGRLRDFPGARLLRVRVEETGLNSFEYAGESGGSEAGRRRE
jgi:6-pyruvoyltetrahydropterin/6-carboxytetrahydropterin synthase